MSCDFNSIRSSVSNTAILGTYTGPTITISAGLTHCDTLTRVNERSVILNLTNERPGPGFPQPAEVLSKQSSDEVEQKLTSRPTDGTIIWL